MRPWEEQPGLILAAAWVGGSVVGTHGVALAIPKGLKAESALVSMGPVAGGWPGGQKPLVQVRAVSDISRHIRANLAT